MVYKWLFYSDLIGFYGDFMVYIWVSYNDLTVLPNPGNHGFPFMALIRISEIL